jgi:flagellar M-ring protein FliF
VGGVLIAAVAIAIGVWSSSTDYEVLFTRLGEGDAASVVEQLKHQKVPYRLSDDGTTIKVPAGQVYETRLALVSNGLTLSGGVGFEIFDRQGFGATEQSQRVAYQRALQGELARTIGALDGVKVARVHLVMPEATMFKRDREESRAAVTLILKPGATLSADQTAGVQRLVAASVSGLDATKVVITDQRGITLAGGDATAAGTAGSDARLAIKRDIEEYVTHKVGNMLDRAFGPGQALVSVDVALNFDDIKSSIQDLVPMRSGGPDGAVMHRRQVESSGSPTPMLNSDAAAASAVKPVGSTTEIDYEYGRRVEQVIAAPGNIMRMSVGVIVPGELGEDKRRRIADLVRMAAGINEARGDAVDVQPLDELGVVKATTPAADAARADSPDEPRPDTRAPKAADPSARGWLSGLAIGLVLAAVGIAGGVLLGRRTAARPASLSLLERQRLLAEIERTLGAETTQSAKAGP